MRSGSAPEHDSEFRPILVVGCQRSGTTALAVMLGRHSRLAALPETQYFTEFVGLAPIGVERRKTVRRALAFPEIAKTGLTEDELLASYRPRSEGRAGLFRAVLEGFAAKNGKARAVEKSCGHLFHADEILRFFPRAKIICIVRDGRDVVLSLRNVPWASSVPVPVSCLQWMMFARATQRLERRLDPGSFAVVRYEELVREPERELRRLCEFVGEKLEPEQLQSVDQSGAVPETEEAWKAKARERPDAARAGAWRRSADPRLIARMNLHMGSMLRTMGYAETEVKGISLAQRLAWRIGFLPFERGVYRLTRGLYRLFRSPRRGAAGGETV